MTRCADLDRLRRSRPLAWLSLGALALALAAAIAAPWVNPKAVQEVCTYAGLSFIVVDDNGDVARPTASSLDCPLCLPAALPPPASPGLAWVPPPSLARTAIAKAEHAALIRWQPPARGPPLHRV